jgi:hypothetical protein
MRLSLEHSEDDQPYWMATAYQYQYQGIGCQERLSNNHLISISYALVIGFFIYFTLHFFNY